MLGWVFYTEPGLRWALARASAASEGRLVIEGASGALARAVTAQRVRYQGDAVSVELRGVTARLHLAAALGGRVVVEPLRVNSAEVVLREGGKPASGPPLIAYGVHLGEAEVARVRLVRAGAVHELQTVRVAHFSLSAGRPPAISGEAAFDLVHERYPAHATVKLGGTLERLELSGTAQANGASAEGRALLAPFERQPLVSLEGRASGVDLARFGELPRTDLSLALKAAGAISGEISVSNAAAGPLDEDRVPIARLQTRFRSADLASAELEGTRLALAGGGEMEGGGTVSAAGVDAVLNVTGLNLRALRSTLRQTSLAGVLRFDLTRDAQLVRGTLSQAGLSVSAEALRKGDTVEVASLHAAAGRGEVTGSGTLRLVEPLEFDARLTLERFNPAAFGDYPQGELSGKLDAKGHAGDAPRAELRWTLAQSTLLEQPFASRGEALVDGRRVSRAEAEATLGGSTGTARGSFGGAGDRLAVTLTVPEVSEVLPDLGGKLAASGTLSGTWTAPEATLEATLDSPAFRRFKARSATLTASGTPGRHEARVHLSAEDAEVDARLRGGVAGQVWTGEIAALEVSGAVPLSLKAPAPLRASRTGVELGRFEAALGEARLLVRELAWSSARVSSSGEFNGLPAQWLVAFAGLTERVRSTMLLDAQWSLATGDKVDGNLRLRRSAGDLAFLAEQPFELGLESLALDARFTPAGVGARLDIVSRAASGGLIGQLGRDPKAGAIGIGPGSALSVKGQIELAGARMLARQFQGEARVDGHLVADVDARGTLAQPVFGGTIRGDALAFEVPAWGVYLKSGVLRARLDGDTLQVERFAVVGGDGTFSASGRLPLRFADGNASVTWRALNFAFVQRPDLRLIASGDGTAGFDGKRLSLSGVLRAERGFVEIDRDRIPKLGEDVVIKGSEVRPVRTKAQLPLALDVDLDLGSRLDIRMYGVEGRLTGRVNVATSKDGELRAYGELRTLNATFFAYGQKLQVDPGIVTFDGPIDNPSLQITAWRRNLQVEAGVQVTGTVRAPRVQLVSQPPVSEGERLSWLVLGRAPTDATKADLGLLQAAAGALLARGDTMPLDRRIARNFGLDEVSFRGSGEVQDRVLAFGKRFSDRLYVTYEQGLGTVVSNLVKMDYSLSRRWSLRAETGTSSGGGLFYRFSWD